MWIFSKLRNDETRSDDPTSKLFEGLTALDALLREALQNSIDAKSANCDESEPVIVKLGLKKVDFKAGSWMLSTEEGTGILHKHFEEAKSQRKTEYPEKLDGEKRCLVIEDFNTTGLCGSLDKNNQEKGSFIRYWWENNISEKGGDSGGSHGLGKETYNSASGCRTVFVLTNREDDNDELLLGFARPGRHVFKNHEYKDYIRFGCREPKREDPRINPYSRSLKNSSNLDEKFNEFCDFFSLERKNNQTGTSFVITNVSDEFNKNSILKSLLNNFSLPLLAGDVEVHLKTDDGKESILSKDTIVDIAADVLDKFQHASFEEKVKLIKKLLNPKGFYFQSTEVTFSTDVHLSEDSFSPSNLEEMRKDFMENKAVKLQIALPVHPIGENSENGIIELIVQNNTSKDIETFSSVFRGSINISNEGSNLKRKIRGLNIIINIPSMFRNTNKINPLSDFFRYCEDPGHVKWLKSPNRRNEKRRYSMVWQRNFVTSLPATLIKILKNEESKKIKNFLDNIFSILKPNSFGHKLITEESSKDRDRPSIRPILPEKVELFAITQDKLKVGFKVSANTPFINNFGQFEETDLELKLRVGYVGLFINKTTALKNSMREIDLLKDYKIESDGIEIMRGEANSILFKILNPEFFILIAGFDVNRDLIIDLGDKKLIDEIRNISKEVA